jgi:hypothetical protein
MRELDERRTPADRAMTVSRRQRDTRVVTQNHARGTALRRVMLALAVLVACGQDGKARHLVGSWVGTTPGGQRRLLQIEGDSARFSVDPARWFRTAIIADTLLIFGPRGAVPLVFYGDSLVGYGVEEQANSRGR